jgi:hypothetical protein
LLVIGLFTSAFFSYYRIYNADRMYREATVNIDMVARNMQSYLSRLGRYPCPGRLDMPRSDPQYGMESADKCDPANAAYAAVAGTCADGLCYENSEKAGAGMVRRGMVPFRMLNLPEEAAYDGYGNRLLYVVTESLAVASSFKSDGGGIRVLDPAGHSAIKLADDSDGYAHMLILSSGPDHKGAFSREGTQIAPCTDSALDGENCNTESDDKATYRAARYATTGDNLHFDDYIKYYNNGGNGLWRASGADGVDMRDNLGDGGRLGIGREPQPDVPGNPQNIFKKFALGVKGNVKAENLLINKHLCDQFGENCFEMEKITGYDDDTNCKDPAAPYVSRVWGGGVNGKVNCKNAGDMLCPVGQYVTQILPKQDDVSYEGRLECAPLDLRCKPKDVDLCIDDIINNNGGVSQIHTLPEGAPAEHIVLSARDITPNIPGDYTRARGYSCYNGEWQADLTWNGVCKAPDCVDIPVADVTEDCWRWFWRSTAPGPWNTYGNTNTYTGMATYRTGRVCPGNGIFELRSDTCACTPTFEEKDVDCGYGFDGLKKVRRDWSCTGEKSGTWTNFYDTGISNCTCRAGSEERNVLCQPMETGMIVEERDFNCSGNTANPSPWRYKSGSCTCAPGQRKTESIPCSEVKGYGWVNSVTRVSEWDCDAKTWSVVSENQAMCAASALSWRPASAAQGGLLANKPNAPALGDECTVQHQVQGCYESKVGGYAFYPECECN